MMEFTRPLHIEAIDGVKLSLGASALGAYVSVSIERAGELFHTGLLLDEWNDLVADVSRELDRQRRCIAMLELAYTATVRKVRKVLTGTDYRLSRRRLTGIPRLERAIDVTTARVRYRVTLYLNDEDLLMFSFRITKPQHRDDFMDTTADATGRLLIKDAGEDAVLAALARHMGQKTVSGLVPAT